MVINKTPLIYSDFVKLTTQQTYNEIKSTLKKMSKNAIIDTLMDYSYIVKNDKSSGTTFEAAAAEILGASVNTNVKHGCDCYYDDGNTIEIKPQNISDYILLSDGNYISKRKLNMSGKYNDFRWHSLIRYILGSPTNSNDTGKYNNEIRNFIDTYYADINYKIFLRVACSLIGTSINLNTNDILWWKLVRGCLPARYKNSPLKKVKDRWDSAVKYVLKKSGKVEPSMWNKYHASVGAVDGTIIYVARIDFCVVYRRLFSKLLEIYPPEGRFKLTKERSQIEFSCSHILKTDIGNIDWYYINPQIEKYLGCMSKSLSNIISTATLKDKVM